MKIEAYSEFGFLLWYYAPKAYWLHTKGKLTSTHSRIGSQPLFYFSKNHTEKNFYYDPPKIPGYISLYGENEPDITKTEWLPPPLKQIYKNELFVFNKPIVTIHNKITLEYGGRGIFNFFSNDFLDELFSILKKKYTIVYIRPPYSNTESFVGDGSQLLINIKDEEVLKKHKDVLYINDLIKINKEFKYNELQFNLLANSEKHISPAGEAAISAYFGGDVLIYRTNQVDIDYQKVWNTDSWLKKFSDANIYGFNTYDEIKKFIIKNWL
jgi:hypothetical protein